MADPIRWGIIGTGSIAERFASGLADVPEAELVGIGSRSADAAATFGERFAVPHRHAGYEALVADRDVDIVYVATPNSLHRQNTLMAVEAGKPVLCEKPLALNAAEAGDMIAAARRRGTFLMEGMWTRFIPAVVRLREMLGERVIGEVEHLNAEYGFRGSKPRLFDPALGGGALLDVGVYPVSFSSMVFGAPTEVRSAVWLGVRGVDERVGAVLAHDGGRLTTMFVSVTSVIPPVATLVGSEGRIGVHPPFHRPSTLTVSREGGEDEVIEIPFRGNGFAHEAIEVMSCVRAGAQESDTMPLEESLQIMRTMDEIRAAAERVDRD